MNLINAMVSGSHVGLLSRYSATQFVHQWLSTRCSAYTGAEQIVQAILVGSLHLVQSLRICCDR